jgi:hypothetical protein
LSFYFRPFVVFRDVYLFFLSSSEFVVFFRVVVPLVWKRSVPFSSSSSSSQSYLFD